VVLWGHDYTGQRLPIGRAEVEITGRQIRASITFDQEDEFARSVESKYRRGFLHTVSVGWNPLKTRGRDVAEWELLDISAVPVPGDADALIQRQLRALRAIGAEPETDTPAWETVAGDMAALYLFPLERSARNWRAAYHRLARDYEQLDKVPPERLQPEYLATLDSEALHGLFLEDEATLLPDLFQQAAQRAALPLPPALRANLEQMRSLIECVLDQQPTVDTPPTPATSPAQDGIELRLRELAAILGATSP
jgi:hypothetical protein